MCWSRAACPGSWRLPAGPEQWSLEQTLFAALRLPDAPGGLVLGDSLALAVLAEPGTCGTMPPSIHLAPLGAAPP